MSLLDRAVAGLRRPDEIELSPERARIPTSRYTSPEVHRREVERVWLRTWQMACREDDVAEPGDVHVHEVAGQSFLVVRQHDGSLRAFHNVCRHRGNRLRRAGGSCTELRCPYHLWAWSLDGALAEVPDRAGFCDLDDGDLGLAPASCDTWGGFVFLHPSPAAEPLLDFLGPEVVEQLAPYHLERMVRVVDVTTPVSANWKVVVEAFLEVYHVQGIHPQLLPMLDDLSTTFECFERHSRMVVPFGVPSMRLEDVPPQEVLEAFVRASGTGSTDGPRTTAGLSVPAGTSARELLIDRARRQGEARGHDYRGLSADQLVDDWHYHLFPNLVFNAHAGAFLFFRIRPDAHSPDRCLFDLQTYVWPDEATRHEHQPMAHVEVPERSMSLGEVLDQDLENLPGVQQGLHSGALDHLTVSRQEIRIVHLHEVLERYLSS